VFGKDPGNAGKPTIDGMTMRYAGWSTPSFAGAVEVLMRRVLSTLPSGWTRNTPGKWRSSFPRNDTVVA
jgi:hypothetical protein